MAPTRPKRGNLRTITRITYALACLLAFAQWGCLGGARQSLKPLSQNPSFVSLFNEMRLPYSINNITIAIDQNVVFKKSFPKGKRIQTLPIVGRNTWTQGCHTFGVQVRFQLRASLFGNKNYSVTRTKVFGFYGKKGKKLRLMFLDQGVMHAFFKRIKIDLEQHPKASKANACPAPKAESYEFRTPKAPTNAKKTTSRPSPSKRTTTSRPVPRRRPTPRR